MAYDEDLADRIRELPEMQQQTASRTHQRDPFDTLVPTCCGSDPHTTDRRTRRPAHLLRQEQHNEWKLNGDGLGIHG
jgi:hypothetical protein